MRCWLCPKRGALWLPVGGAEVWLCRPCATALVSCHDRCATCGHLRFASLLVPEGGCSCTEGAGDGR